MSGPPRISPPVRVLMGPVPERERLAPLTTVAVPAGNADAVVRRALLDDYGIEIGAGLGPFKGNTWRIGLMGSGSSRRNVVTCLGALAGVLQRQGVAAVASDAVAAAEAVWRSAAE